MTACEMEVEILDGRIFMMGIVIRVAHTKTVRDPNCWWLASIGDEDGRVQREVGVVDVIAALTLCAHVQMCQMEQSRWLTIT